MGQFGDFLSRCEEDVVVLAHTHTWKEHEIESTKNGDIFYINTGTWIDYASDVSMASRSSVRFFFSYFLLYYVFAPCNNVFAVKGT